jgi:hypothetical protein
MQDKTTQQVRDMNLNPTGKGGFNDNPQNINAGGRPKNSQRYDYWMQFFKDMEVSKLKTYTVERTEDIMFVAEAQAYQRVVESLKDFKVWQVVADRTEGKAPQFIGLGDKEDYNIALVEFINGDDKDTDTPGV